MSESHRAYFSLVMKWLGRGLGMAIVAIAIISWPRDLPWFGITLLALGTDMVVDSLESPTMTGRALTCLKIAQVILLVVISVGAIASVVSLGWKRG